ncbi:MAG: hypothetical protein A2176_11505 [Spirochaetes bacterium RBG_13_51_14]|nr:MAG: hypothetical protein A2176_11505 [Spirochaetes bacterium RBG_13_51_14]
MFKKHLKTLRKNAFLFLAVAVVSVIAQSGCAPLAPGKKCYVKEIGSTGKYIMHLEGTPYEIGYAMGYFRPKEVERMCSFEYFQGVLDDSLGEWAEILEPLYEVKWLVDLGIDIFKILTNGFRINVPEEYLDEMQGIVDGVKAADPHSTLEFDDVLMLNLSVDVLLSLQYSLYYPLDSATESCNSFVAFNNATSDGRTLMGNHFMYPAAVYHEVALYVEYVPQSGHKFISVTAPGFVGLTTAMNDRGVAIQTHVLTSGDTDYDNIGMGVLLLSRKAIQYSDSMKEAVETIRDAKRGVPWIYALGEPGGGAVIESTAGHFSVRYAGSAFENQIEDKDDLIISTNHALTPEVIAVQHISSTGTTLRRYQDLAGLLVGSYGSINEDNGRGMIDFLHPGGPYSYYYGNDPNQPVACHVSLFDLTNKRLWSLFGLYSDPWVSYELKE